MRPQTNAQIAKALKDQAAYATDSETKWLMEEAAKRIDAPPLMALVDGGKVTIIAEAQPESQPAQEQKTPAAPAKADKPQRLPRKKPVTE